MKRIIVFSAVFSCLCFPAEANTKIAFKPYMGFDLQRTSVDYQSDYDLAGNTVNPNRVLQDNLNGASVFIGNRFNDYIGFELGYFRTREKTKGTQAGDNIGPGTVALADFDANVQLQGVTLDVVGFLPMTERFDFLATAGVSWTKGDISVDIPGLNSISTDEKEFGYRAGFGLQYGMTEALSLRGIMRYQNLDMEDIVDRGWLYSLGLNYTF